ncbi:serine-rich adhesin for platelets isoform X2 [Malaya genurostris]|uniref:serine-rich adhesin for platelets isoform X2 n=1 Tax=Malaya genurostris TaxID=325434 RepID=UPI0026F38545|nr:serine-rich adhesin for platelets isoform X2 [Malaya genurostris]
MDIIDVDELLGDDSFIGDTEQLDDEVVEILKQWKSCSTLPSISAIPATSSNSSFGFSSTSHHLSRSQNSSLNSDAKGLKFVDTRTFTRPKKRLDTTFASPNTSAELPPAIREHSLKVSSPLLNLQIGGPVSQTSNGSVNASPMLQRSWLGDVSPPGSIMSSMEFSVNDKMGTSLITSGDFTNVSYLLNGANGGDEMLNSQSNYDGYKLADVIKDRHFLESLSCFDDNSLTKDCAISKTDLNGIEENTSGFSTMQNSLESVTKNADGRLSDATIALGNGMADVTFELEPKEVVAPIRAKLNGTFERRRNFDTYRKPKSGLNETRDALPNVGDEETTIPNRTFDAESDNANPLNTTFGMSDNGNGTFSLNRTANVNGADKQLNQTYEYCEKISPEIPAVNRTFEQPKNATYVDELNSPEIVSSNGNHTPNGTFELPTDRGKVKDTVTMVQSTPFGHVPRASRVTDICQYEVNVSPIASHSARRLDGMRRSRNLENEMSSHLETDDFDVEFRKLPSTPSTKTDSSNGSHLLDNEKRISLQHFEDFEKSILESEHNGVDFDEMLNSLTDVKRSMDSVKMRQSLDNIKKRHSRMNSEKQLEDIRKRSEMNDSVSSSSLDNKLADSMAKSMSSSSGSERLLNRRSRYNDDVHLTLSPQPQQQLQKSIDVSVHDLEHNPTNETTTVESVDPVPTAPEVGNSDKKNRDRFKTIRINKRLAEGMVVVPSPEEPDDCQFESVSLSVEEELPGSPTVTKATMPSAFSRKDYNSPKDCRFSITPNYTDHHSKTEDTVFKRPQDILESKPRSLSKPRYYGGPGGGFGIAKKDMSLPLTTKSSSTDNLENDRPNYQQPPSYQSRLSIGGKPAGGFNVGSGPKGGSTVQSNLKSPMGTKSKSYHNLYFNQSNHGGSNSSLNRGSTPLGLSAQKMSHNNSNNELSGVQMRLPKSNSRLGLVRPSSGYFSYGSHKKNGDSDTESINSLSSSSASSRGSLYRVDSQSIANHVQNTVTNSIDDISGTMGVHSGNSVGPKVNNIIESKRTTVNSTKMSMAGVGTPVKPSGIRPPSNLRPPTARSALPRPTSYVRR